MKYNRTAYEEQKLMTGTLMTLILFAFMIVMILRVVKLYGRQKKNQKILDLLDFTLGIVIIIDTVKS